MILNYKKQHRKKALFFSGAFVLLLTGFYFSEVISLQNESPFLTQIQQDEAQIAAFIVKKKELSEKIEKLKAIDSETTKLLANRKKYEMNPTAEQGVLIEIFNMLSREYGLFDIAVLEVMPNEKFLNLLDVRLLVSSNEFAVVGDNKLKSAYIRKMRELVVLYLYKNKNSFSIYNEIEKVGDDTLTFQIINRG